MNGSILDTNVIIRLLSGDEKVRSVVYGVGNICIPSVVIGELLFGVGKSADCELNRKRYLDFCAPYLDLEVNLKVAEEYGKIKFLLRNKGCILPENDVWIAATALANEMSIVTQDERFENVPNLSVIMV